MRKLFDGLAPIKQYFSNPNSTVGIVKRIWDEWSPSKQNEELDKIREELRQFAKTEMHHIKEKGFVLQQQAQAKNDQKVDARNLAKSVVEKHFSFTKEFASENQALREKNEEIKNLAKDKNSISEADLAQASAADIALKEIEKTMESKEFLEANVDELMKEINNMDPAEAQRVFTREEMKGIFKEAIQLLGRLEGKLDKFQLEGYLNTFDPKHYFSIADKLSPDALKVVNQQIYFTLETIKQLLPVKAGVQLEEVQPPTTQNTTTGVNSSEVLIFSKDASLSAQTKESSDKFVGKIKELLSSAELPINVKKKYESIPGVLDKLTPEKKKDLVNFVCSYSQPKTGKIPLGKLLVVVGELILTSQSKKATKKR